MEKSAINGVCAVSITDWSKRLAALALVSALAGCQSGGIQQALNIGSSKDKQTEERQRITQAQLRGYCPRVTLRENTGYYNTYEKNAEGDPDSVIYQAAISDVTRSCEQSDGFLNMKVAAAGRVVPGPKGKDGTITMPIRVAVLEGDQVVYSQLTQHQVQIDTGGGATQFLVTDENVQVPIQQGSRFRVYVGYDEGPYNTP